MKKNNIKVFQNNEIKEPEFKVDVDDFNVIKITDQNNQLYTNRVIRKYSSIYYGLTEMMITLKNLFGLDMPKLKEYVDYTIVAYDINPNDSADVEIFVSEKYIHKLIKYIRESFETDNLLLNKRIEYFLSIYNSKVYEDTYVKLNLKEPNVSIKSYTDYMRLVDTKNIMNNPSLIVTKLLNKSKELESLAFQYSQLINNKEKLNK